MERGSDLSGHPSGPFDKSIAELTILAVLPQYLAYAEHEWRFSPKTLKSYTEAILRVVKAVGDIRPQQLTLNEVLALKTDLGQKNIGVYWTRGILNALRSFLRFCLIVLNLQVLDPKKITLPRIPKRQVVFLTPEEIEQFISAIPIYDKKRRFNLRWLCFRALVEVLLATGMRISEALRVQRLVVNFETGEAEIVGKGNKQRTIFFTPRAIGWIKEYINRRSDASEWLFVLPSGRSIRYDTVRKWFRRACQRAGLKKKVTPHILRHTCATTLLFNGCPIGHIKEILGHERLITTCEYYLGEDKKAAKDALRKYLQF